VRLLLEHKCDVNIVDKDNNTPFTRSCEGNPAFPMIQLLLEYKADVHAKGNYSTPLAQLTRSFDMSVANLHFFQFLCSKPLARPDVPSLTLGSFIRSFHRIAGRDSVVLLLEKGVGVDEAGGEDETALSIVAAYAAEYTQYRWFLWFSHISARNHLLALEPFLQTRKAR
jgi:ankyrin repeat protein